MHVLYVVGLRSETEDDTGVLMGRGGWKSGKSSMNGAASHRCHALWSGLFVFGGGDASWGVLEAEGWGTGGAVMKICDRCTRHICMTVDGGSPVGTGSLVAAHSSTARCWCVGL